MAIISASDFTDWKSNAVTKAFFEAAQLRVEEAKDILSYSAGVDPLYDKYLTGLISAYREMQEFRVEDTVDGN